MEKTLFQKNYISEERRKFMKINRIRRDCPDLTPEFIKKAKREYEARGE